jgi:hypothetical protein
MPTPNVRPSLTTTLDVRYAKQHAGGAFEVKDVLGGPGTEPAAGKTIDASSQQGATNQNPNGFLVKVLPQVSQFIAVQSGGAGNNYSLYVKGLDTTRYHS